MNWLIFFLFFIIIFFFFFFFFFYYSLRDVVNKIRFWLLIHVLIRAIVKVLSLLQGCMHERDSELMKVLNEIDNEEELGEELAKKITIVGRVDMRMRLDKRISSDNKKYTASLSMMAAKLSYELEDVVNFVLTKYWKMDNPLVLSLWKEKEEEEEEENQTSKTQAIMFNDKKANLIVVAFRGTNPLDAGALITDFELDLYEIKGHKKMEGRAHLGFMKALGLKKHLDWPKPEEITDEEYLSQHPAYYEIRERLRKQLLEDEEGKTKFIVTGHSLGGALAILFVGLLGYHEDTLLLEKMEGVYTFGQPRVGDDKFKDFMNSTIKKYGVKYLRYVYSNDVITRVPYDDQMYRYKHFGETYIYFDCFYRGRVESEEINKNYCALSWFIPRHLIAICELIRSFAIHHIDAYGGDYKEGWLMITIRCLGLLFPGLSAHMPQDYVNISRLEISPPRSISNRLFKRGMLAIIASFVLFYLIQWTNYYTNYFNKKI